MFEHIKTTTDEDFLRTSNFSAVWRSLVSNGTWTNEKFVKLCLEAIRAEKATDCDNAEKLAFRYIYPALLTLAIIGCSLTLLVYGSKFLKNTSTVLFLATKASANLFGVLCLSMEMMRHFYNTTTEKNKNEKIEEIVWYSRPYTLFFANYFGTLAVWCTLAITIETYMCIAHTIQFRKWSNKRNGYIVLIILILLDLAHHSALPIVLTIEKNVACFATLTFYSMKIKNRPFYLLYEKIYFYINCIAVIIVPNLLMLVLSLLIAYHLKFKSIGEHFSQRRRCVLRITITTTVCYLILETPNLLMFLPAAMRGSEYRGHDNQDVTSDNNNNNIWCIINVVTNFLAMLNAVVPFFVYVTFNNTFRELLFMQMRSKFRFTKYFAAKNNNNRRDIETSYFLSCVPQQQPYFGGSGTHHSLLTPKASVALL